MTGSAPPGLAPSAESAARPLALVTGGARRVGRAICLELARAGCDVCFTFRSSGRDAESLREELAAAGAHAEAFPLDLDDLGSVSRFACDFSRARQRLDILVHNASVYGSKPFEDVTANDLLTNYRVNAAAPALMTREVLPLLRRSILRGRGGAAVVAMCDMHALGRPRARFAPYLMSKAALAGMVEALAVELAPDVRVNGVAPGVVAFPETGEESEEGFRTGYVSRIPLARAGTPEDAAGAVRWLALDAAYVTGEIIRLDGGRWLRP